MQRDNKLDSVRSFCNILVVFAHSWAVDQYCAVGGFEYWSWRTVNAMVCCLAPTLFVMSGYLARSGYSPDTFGRKLVGRVKRLVVPYVAWNVLYAVFYLAAFSFVPRLSQRVNTFNLTTLSGFISKTMGIFEMPIDGPLWYLRAVLGYFLLFPIAMFIVRKFGWRILWAIVIILGVVLHVTDLEVLNGKCYPFYGFTMYLFGAWLSEKQLTPYQVFSSRWLLIFPLIGVLLSFGLFTGVVSNYHNLARTTYWFLMMPLLWVFAAEIERFFSKFPLAAWFKGGSGYFVYASHFLFCGCVLHSVAPFLGGHWTGKFYLLVCVFFCGLPVSILARKIAIRIFPQAMKVFDGTL